MGEGPWVVSPADQDRQLTAARDLAGCCERIGAAVWTAQAAKDAANRTRRTCYLTAAELLAALEGVRRDIDRAAGLAAALGIEAPIELEISAGRVRGGTLRRWGADAENLARVQNPAGAIAQTMRGWVEALAKRPQQIAMPDGRALFVPTREPLDVLSGLPDGAIGEAVQRYEGIAGRRLCVGANPRAFAMAATNWARCGYPWNRFAGDFERRYPRVFEAEEETKGKASGEDKVGGAAQRKRQPQAFAGAKSGELEIIIKGDGFSIRRQGDGGKDVRITWAKLNVNAGHGLVRLMAELVQAKTVLAEGISKATVSRFNARFQEATGVVDLLLKFRGPTVTTDAQFLRPRPRGK